MILSFIKASVGNVVVLIIGFITMFLISRFINVDDYGNYSFLLTVAIMLSNFLSFGFLNYFCREYYNYENKFLFLIKCLIIPIILYTSFALCFVIFAREFNFQYFLMLLYIFIFQFEIFLSYLLRFSQKITIYNLTVIISNIAYLFFVLLAIVFGNSAIELLFLGVIAKGLITVLIGLYVAKNSNKTNISFSTRKALFYSWPFIISNAFICVIVALDKYVLMFFFGSEYVAYYSMALGIAAVFSVLKLSIDTYFIPIILKKYTDGENYIETMQKSIYVLIMFFSLGFGCVFIFQDLIYMYLGPQYISAYNYIMFLMLTPLFTSIADIFIIPVNIDKKTTKHITISAIMFSITLITEVALAQVFGPLSVCFASSICWFIFMYLRLYQSQKITKIKYPIKYLNLFILIVYILIFINCVTDVMLLNIIFTICILLVVFIKRNELKKF